MQRIERIVLPEAKRSDEYPVNAYKSLGRGSVIKRALEGTKDQ